MPDNLPRDSAYFIEHLYALGLAIRAAVLGGVRSESAEELSYAVADRGGDTIYRLDEHGEDALLAYCAASWLMTRDIGPIAPIGGSLRRSARAPGNCYPHRAQPYRSAFLLPSGRLVR